MNSRTNQGFQAAIVAATVLIGASGAQAATLASGPLWLAVGDDYSCSAANTSNSKDIVVEVSVTIDGSIAGSGSVESCAPLTPRTVCSADNEAGGAKYRYCTITTSSKQATRGTFCNKTTGVCIPVQ